MDTWILRMVRKRCKRRVAAWTLAVGCVFLLAFSAQRYITNFILGPFDFGPAELDSISDISTAPRYFAKITGSEAIDTGIKQITIHKQGGVETSREVSGTYYALKVGKKFLIVRSTDGAPTTVEGELTPMPFDLTQKLFSTPEMQANRKNFYNLYITDESFRLPGYIAIVGLAIFVFLLYKRALPAWKHLQDPSSHPVILRVSSWGDPILLATEIEHDFGSPRHKGGGWFMGDNYIVQASFFKFDVLRNKDLLWAYKRVTRHSINFVPTGKTYDAVLVCYGGVATIKGREKAVDAILVFAAGRAPWIILGFSKEIMNLYNENTNAFCVAVEQRKHDWQQKDSQQA